MALFGSKQTTEKASKGQRLEMVGQVVSFYEPLHGKTNNLHRRKTKAQISFAVTAIVQSLFYLNPKF